MHKPSLSHNQIASLVIPQTDGIYPLPLILDFPRWSAIVVQGTNRFFVSPDAKVPFQGSHFRTPDGRTVLVEGKASWLPERLVRTTNPTEKLILSPSPVAGLLGADGSAIELSPSVTTVGRQPWCDLALRDSSVSSVHCVIFRSPEATYLFDAQSLNGSLVNRHRIQQATLSPGDLIQLGGTVFLAAETGLGDPKKKIIHLNSLPMQNVDRLVTRMAPSDAPVLIQGETGVGKESIAAAIHRRSGRKGNFVALNAATLRPELAASTLFGHRKGAFTGAVHDAKGAFKTADRGTLFLDEVAELSPEVQAKLLRVIETGQIRAVGDVEARKVDVRIVTATHKNLCLQVQVGAFREDLFHRLYVLPISLPPLRERPVDIKALAENFLKSQVPPRSLSKAAERKLVNHPWPGNIRELINTLRRACVLCHSPVLPPEGVQFLTLTAAESPLNQLICKSVVDAYKHHGKSVAQTAKSLGIHRETVSRHLKAAKLL